MEQPVAAISLHPGFGKRGNEMKYTVQKTQHPSDKELEQRLGLNSGDIKEVNTYPDGMIEIEIDDAIAASLSSDATAMAKADQLIDAITNLAGAKIFLKRLVARLIKTGALP